MVHVSEVWRTAAVIPAAGRGLRMGGERKQFRLLGDAPLFLQTARLFMRHPRVDEVVLVTSARDVDDVRRLIAETEGTRVHVVEGGATRSQSVRAGLAAVGTDVTMVLVHDAVRPFVTAAQVDAVLNAVQEHDAAAPALQVNDTLRELHGATFGTTLDRSKSVRVQTPQGFRRTLLLEAYARSTDDHAVTDDAELVMAIGRQVHMVPGSVFNVKLTTEEDWALAVMLWPAWSNLELRETP